MTLVRVKVETHGDVKAKLAKITLNLDAMQGAFVSTGWGPEEKYPNGTRVALVALINEFGSHNSDGTVRSPARPFMRPAYKNNRAALIAVQKQAIADVLDGKITAEKALNIIGFRMWSFVRAAILSNPAPANAPSTTAKKRRAGRPAVSLIDTRRMLDTLSYKVYLGGKGKPPMKEEPVTPGSGGGGGGTGTTIKPQHAPGGGGTGFSPMTPAEVKGIPKVMSPDERKREKKRLRDALKKPRKKAGGAKDPSPSGPGGGKRVVVRVGGGKKPAQLGPKPSAPTGPKAPKAPKAPRSPSAPQAPRTGTGTHPKSPGTAPRRPRTGATPKKPRATAPKVVRPPRKADRDKKRDERDKVRKERQTRSKTAHHRRGKGLLDQLEEALLRNIISLARAASRYGRSL